MTPVVHLLIALVVIIVTTRLVGAAFRLIDQPSVIGEVVGGLMLGPSLLGRIAPDAYVWLLPQEIVPILMVYAQFGIVLFMFLVGLDLDLARLRKGARATIFISHASIVVPFALGSALAVYLYPVFAPPNVRLLAFALFLGVSMSITAFPVLARILTDRGISRSPMGAMALTCAAVDDVTAWCLLAGVVSIVRSEGVSALTTVALTVVFIAFLIAAVRPVVERVIVKAEASPEARVSSLMLILAGLLASTVATDYIGIHTLFGAFLFGAVVPTRARSVLKLDSRLQGIVAVLFLPVFFALTGMRTEIGLIEGGYGWLMTGLILLVACAGKLGGSYVAARFAGVAPRDAAALGILMNTRGLVELIMLNIGYELGVISRPLFAMLVIMAVVTTFMTAPILRVLLKERSALWREDDGVVTPGTVRTAPGV